MTEDDNEQMDRSMQDAVSPRRRKFPWAMLVVVLLFVVIPFLSWYGTWFGAPLSDSKIEQYLHDNEKPRNVQHALEQIVERMVAGDQKVKKWYPTILALADHPTSQVRSVTAWVMGHDNSSDQFHSALVGMLGDDNPTVRHNAALALVRFGDDRGRKELLEMLMPKLIRAEASGKATVLLGEGAAFSEGSPLVRVEGATGDAREIRAAEAGRIESISVAEGEVSAGDKLLVLSPTIEQVWETLRALYLVGQPEDIPVIQRYTRELPGMPDRVREQATLTTQAIRERRR